MKYATLLGLTILMASSPAAMAKVDRDCLRNMRDLSIPLAQAKHMCDSKYDAKPHEWGWTCVAVVAAGPDWVVRLEC